ncbi:MAG: acetylxylan esterase, partial [Spirochaetales bacterium]|nr:acetylxylan esterase [Spirochaetales bacterium]
MQLFDLSLEELKKYNPEIYKPENFNLFWDSKIIESESQPLNIEIKNIQDSFDG